MCMKKKCLFLCSFLSHFFPYPIAENNWMLININSNNNNNNNQIPNSIGNQFAIIEYNTIKSMLCSCYHYSFCGCWINVIRIYLSIISVECTRVSQRIKHKYHILDDQNNFHSLHPYAQIILSKLYLCLLQFSSVSWS